MRRPIVHHLQVMTPADIASYETAISCGRPVNALLAAAMLAEVAALTHMIADIKGIESALGDKMIARIEYARAMLNSSERIESQPWASASGHDRFGAWAAFSVIGQDGPVVQRMRWCPPGQFLMGSPDDEPGRDSYEGPQHPVTLSQGFWMMDTPCTQALWQAVMGADPSYFKGDPALPVECVSWTDAQDFRRMINWRIPDLALALPTEAQWEYACRAGTGTARYGEIDGNTWYAANSERETHPVGQKQPNPWGLHDMLGNVWEWCHDGRRAYTAEAQTDPAGPLETGANRVLRGGSWFSFMREIRAACRCEDHAINNYDTIGNIGFRCCRNIP